MINNLSKLVLENGGSISPLLIPYDQSQGLGLCNPSIFVDNGIIYVNMRNVYYVLHHSENNQKFQNAWGGPLAYLNSEDDIKLRTVNFLCTLNPDTLEIETYNKVDTSKLDTEPQWEFVGLEDARVVMWDNNLYLIGVRRDTTTTGEGRMELSNVVNNKEISRNRIQHPPRPDYSYCEKNWMPIIDMPYCFVKWTNPLEIVKVDLKTNTSEVLILKQDVVDLPFDLRGGSQVIPFENYRITITHEVDLFNNENGNKDAKYYHRFIVWDKDWNIVKISPQFMFMSANIEFSCGLTLYNDDLLITFGYQDTTSYLLKMPVAFFKEFIL
jgi:hypothetical protein